MEVDLHTTLYVGECHLEESSNQTTGADIVTSHYPAAVDELLYGVEAVNEVLRVLHGRNIAAHLAQALSKSRTSEALLVEAEVDMIEARVLVVNENWTNHLLNIRNLTTGTYDNGTRSDDLLAVRILLGQ